MFTSSENLLFLNPPFLSILPWMNRNQDEGIPVRLYICCIVLVELWTFHLVFGSTFKDNKSHLSFLSSVYHMAQDKNFLKVLEEFHSSLALVGLLTLARPACVCPSTIWHTTSRSASIEITGPSSSLSANHLWYLKGCSLCLGLPCLVLPDCQPGVLIQGSQAGLQFLQHYVKRF